MDYVDFRVRIERGQDGLRVRASSPAAGEAAARFEFPEVAAQAARLAEELERAVNAARGSGETARKVSVGSERAALDPSSAALGERLFSALLPEGVRERFFQALGQIDHDDGRGLRLRIATDPGDPDLARVLALPWEYLRRPDIGSFLAAQRKFPLVRHLDVPLPGGRPPLPPPVRVLAAGAEPSDLPALRLAEELEQIERLWGQPGEVEVVPLARTTVPALRAALLAGGFHVLHFVGHGGFDAATGEGALFFVDEAGRADPVGAGAFADQLRDFTSLRLVFLNACQSAQAAAGAPFAGVATALLRAGVPAVLAMQFPITDRAALEFGGIVYRRLAAGDPVDAAVAEGRLALAARGSAEWGTPVLFLRAPDGRLFAPPAAAEREPAPNRSPWRLPAFAAVIAVLGLLAALAGLWPWKPASGGGAKTAAPATDAAQQFRQQSFVPPIVKDPQPDRGHHPSNPDSSVRQSPPKPAETLKVEAKPRKYTVGANPLSIPAVQAEVSVRFQSYNGEPLATLSIAVEGFPTVNKAVTGPESVEFDTAKGKAYLDVLALSWATQTVKVRPRRNSG
jgi:CHAT domain-containing protein